MLMPACLMNHRFAKSCIAHILGSGKAATYRILKQKRDEAPGFAYFALGCGSSKDGRDGVSLFALPRIFLGGPGVHAHAEEENE